MEAGQHALHLGEQLRVVGVGPQEAEDLVESQHLVGPLEPPLPEADQQRELPRADARAVLDLQPLELLQQARGPLGHDPSAVRRSADGGAAAYCGVRGPVKPAFRARGRPRPETAALAAS